MATKKKSDIEQVKAEQETKAAKRIVKLTVELDAASESTRKARKEWNQLRQEQRATMRARIEKAETLPTPNEPKAYAEVRAKLDGILEAYQRLDEIEAGRKDALHECLSRERDLKKKLRKSLDQARQLSLFDDVDLSELDEEENENDAHQDQDAEAAVA